MKRLATLTVVLLCNVPGPHGLSAQSLLSQLEQRLPSESVPPAAPGSTAPRGYLGAKLDNADEQGKTGVRVTEVVSGTPAESGGLKSGDLITAINGKPVANLDGYDVVADGPAGTRLQMTVDRAGKKTPVTVTLGTKPATPPAAASPPSIPARASEPQLGAPSLSPPGGVPSTSPPADSTLPRSTFPRSSPSLSPAPGGEASSLPAPSFGSSPPASELSPALPSPLPTPGLSDRGSDSTPSGIRAQPLDLGSPPSATIGDDTLPPASRSTPPASTGGNASIGISVLPLTEQTRQRLNIPVRRGALIDSVRSLSPADQAGLPVDAVIVRFDDRPIESDQDLINAVRAARPGQEVEIAYYEGNRLSRKVLTLAAAGAAGSSPPPTGYSDSGLGSTPSATTPGGSTAPRTGRPGGLLSRIDRMADNLARPQSTMTVWDPLAMASMQARVEELTKTVNSLQERIRTLESKLGVSSTSLPTPTSPSTATPGLGSPSISPTNNP